MLLSLLLLWLSLGRVFNSVLRCKNIWDLVEEVDEEEDEEGEDEDEEAKEDEEEEAMSTRRIWRRFKSKIGRCCDKD